MLHKMIMPKMYKTSHTSNTKNKKVHNGMNSHGGYFLPALLHKCYSKRGENVQPNKIIINPGQHRPTPSCY